MLDTESACSVRVHVEFSWRKRERDSIRRVIASLFLERAGMQARRGLHAVQRLRTTPKILAEVRRIEMRCRAIPEMESRLRFLETLALERDHAEYDKLAGRSAGGDGG